MEFQESPQRKCLLMAEYSGVRAEGGVVFVPLAAGWEKKSKRLILLQVVYLCA